MSAYKNIKKSAPSKATGSLHTAQKAKTQQKQRTILQARTLLGLKLLTFPNAELKIYLDNEIAENPLLEKLPNLQQESEDKEGIYSLEESLRSEIKKDEIGYSFDYENTSYEYETSNSHQGRTPSSGDSPLIPLRKTKSVSSIIEETANQKISLEEELLLQLALRYGKNTEFYTIGAYLITLIDWNGFLVLEGENLEKTRNILKTVKKKIKKVIAEIKTFDPPGIGACNVQEALIIQIERLEQQAENQSVLEKISLENVIVSQHFDLLKNKKYLEIARKLDVSLSMVKEALYHISFLEPTPARNYRVTENLYVTPDATVECFEGKLEVTLFDMQSQLLQLNPEYISYLETFKGGQKEGKNFISYLHKHKRDAIDLINSLEYRESTLLKILNRLTVIQKDYFTRGMFYLRPYSLTDLSKDIDVSISVLSRAVNMKHISTRWGIILLRKLFSQSKIPILAHAENSVQAVSSSRIKQLICDILEAYPQKKLSDEKIKTILTEKGYVLARRTIAKYRQNLNIPSSRTR